MVGDKLQPGAGFGVWGVWALGSPTSAPSAANVTVEASEDGAGDVRE
jgi:hypothetical protein